MLGSTEGWHVELAHFAERHGLIIIIALGESIVVLEVGASVGVHAGVLVAVALGLTVAAAVALCGGVALYLLALSAFKRRNVGSFNNPRLVARIGTDAAHSAGDCTTRSTIARARRGDQLRADHI